ncbi:hypothetical protein HDZ31DRAFT_67919 [Schizophyllum fasciatum]
MSSSTLEKTKELQYQALEPWKVSSIWRSRCLDYHPDCRTHPRQSDNPWSFEAFSQDTSNSIARDRDLAEAFARGATIEDGAQPQSEQDAVSTARQLGRSYRAAPSAPPTPSQADLGPSPSAARNVVDVDDGNDSGDAGDLGDAHHTSGPSFTSRVNVTIQSNCSRIPRGPQPVSRAALSHTTPARSTQSSRAHPSHTSQDAAGMSASTAQPSRIYGASSSATSSSILQAASSARSRSTSPRKPRGPSFTVILAAGRPAVIAIDEQRVLELMRSFTAAGARPRLQRAGSWEQALSLVPDLETEEGDVFFVLERDGDAPREKAKIFWPKFLSAWEERFPFHLQDSVDVPEGLGDEARDAFLKKASEHAQKDIKPQFVNFFNNTRTKLKATSSSPFTEFFKRLMQQTMEKPKRDSPIQFFMKMEEHRDDVEEEAQAQWAAAGRPERHILKYRQSAAKELYDAQSDEFRADVERQISESYKERMRAWEAGSEPTNMTDEQKAEYRENLLSVLEPLLTDLLSMAGLTAGVVLAGRPPTENDPEYDTIIIPVGRTIAREGSLNFAEWRSRIFEELIVRHFLQFVRKTTG